MAKARRPAWVAARVAQVRLPRLEAFGGGALEPDGDYDGVEFTGGL
ncbi:hypothetical protein AB0903_10020 [Streptomyces sp. NPDC048389]